MSTWVIYRGPLERSRLSLLLKAFALTYGEVSFLWIFPGVMTPERLSGFESYIASQPVKRHEIINAPIHRYLETRAQVQGLVGHSVDNLIGIGFSSLWFASGIKTGRLVWCVNGIPEEKELTSMFSRLFTQLYWKVCKLFPEPSLIVVVSEQMKKLVSARMPGPPSVAIPTCADLSTFRRTGLTNRNYFTYLGTGAPWQALDLLSGLWQAIHKQDPSIKFRIISRDSRAKVLGQQINPANIEFVSSHDFDEVAQWLNEAEVGFLIRRDTLVNQVSFPTKLGEYLAAGAWVVSSDFEWAVKEHIDKHHCGVLVSSPDAQAAKVILDFRKNIKTHEMAENIRKAADALDRDPWISLLVEKLNQLT